MAAQLVRPHLHGWQYQGTRRGCQLDGLPAVYARAQKGRRAVLGGLCTCSGCACIRHRNSWYDGYFAFNMAHGMDEYEAAVQPIKHPLFQQLLQPLNMTGSSAAAAGGAASVLEVGIGTGPNLLFYTPSFTQAAHTSNTTPSSSQAELIITGLEPNEAMWPYAQEAAAAAGLQPAQLQLVAGDAQEVPFSDASFDAAVITLVLCSVPSPQQVLREVHRVLKPGGQLLLIEHVIAPQLGLLQLQQRLLNPLQRLLADNCHLSRDTAAVVQSSGLQLQPLPPLPVVKGILGSTLDGGSDGGDHGDAGDGSRLLPGGYNGGLNLWRFEVDSMGLIAPHIAGILRKAAVP